MTDRKFLRANMLALIYRHPTYGVFNVLQDGKLLDEATLESIAEQCNALGSGCSAEAGMVPVTDGVRGLQLAGCVANSVKWAEAGVVFDVLGPSQTFSPGESLEVARLVATAGPS